MVIPWTRYRRASAKPEARLPRGNRIEDEIGPETDVLDPHHSDRMIDMIDPALERRCLRVDSKRERHHTEHAAARRDLLELPIGEVPSMVVDSATRRVSDRERQIFLHHVAPRLL